MRVTCVVVTVLLEGGICVIFDIRAWQTRVKGGPIGSKIAGTRLVAVCCL